MSYLDDYESSSRNKIPYDDIPISRSSSSSSKRRSSSKAPMAGVNKILICLVSVMFVINIVLCSVSVYFLRHSKTKEVNVFYNNINADTESSAPATSTAWWSSVCVAAGGTVSTNDAESFFTSARSRGSGIIYRIASDNKTIYFVTCYHVISGYEDKVWVLLPSQLKPIAVEVVSYSSHYDIAVLKYKSSTTAEDVLEGCTPIQIYDSTYLSVGDDSFAVGNPLSNGFSVTKGIISRINTLITVDNNNYLSREIQTDAAINPGNSGGGLFNAEGKFIGLINAKLNTSKSGTTTITVAGTAYAIPSTLVCSIVESIIKNNGKATYVNLGVEFENDLDMGITQTEVQYQGKNKKILRNYVVVDSVISGSIAYRKLHAGDIIDSVEFSIIENGKSVQKKVEMFNIYNFEDHSFAIVSGSEIKFNIRRNGITEETVTVLASSFKHIDGE